ncbi:hypothetical protein TWF730_006791 [Orbilia blumenaviensis]|uniref:Uncharacterized protein n=1 Tax=Orbilia blumenaviensis TaxID=1796055 RepID=A0AAV9VHM8_9PEZI
MRVSIFVTSFLLTATTLAIPFGARLDSREVANWNNDLEQLTALQKIASGTDEEIKFAAHEAGLDKLLKPTGYTTHAVFGGRSLIKNIGLSLMGTLGVPKDMLELIGAVPDPLLKSMIKQPLGKLKASLDSLKAGKIPELPGVSPKELIMQVLPNLGVPANMVNLIKAAPDEFIGKITSLPGGQLSSTIKELKAGKIPTIPGVDKTEMILSFLPSLGLPSVVVDILKATPGAIEKLGSMTADELQKLLDDFKNGKFTGIPGLDVGETPSTTPTTPTTPGSPIGSAPATPILPGTPGTPVDPALPVTSGTLPGTLPLDPATPSTPAIAPVLPLDPAGPVASAPAGALPVAPIGATPVGATPVGLTV